MMEGTMSLRDEIAELVRQWPKGAHSLDIADAILALLRDKIISAERALRAAAGEGEG